MRSPTWRQRGAARTAPLRHVRTWPPPTLPPRAPRDPSGPTMLTRLRAHIAASNSNPRSRQRRIASMKPAIPSSRLPSRIATTDSASRLPASATRPRCPPKTRCSSRAVAASLSQAAARTAWAVARGVRPDATLVPRSHQVDRTLGVVACKRDRGAHFVHRSLRLDLGHLRDAVGDLLQLVADIHPAEALDLGSAHPRRQVGLVEASLGDLWERPIPVADPDGEFDGIADHVRPVAHARGGATARRLLVPSHTRVEDPLRRLRS